MASVKMEVKQYVTYSTLLCQYNRNKYQILSRLVDQTEAYIGMTKYMPEIQYGSFETGSSNNSVCVIDPTRLSPLADKIET